MNPDTYYKNQGWSGWKSLGFKRTRRGFDFYPYEEFKKIIQKHIQDILKSHGEGLKAKYQTWLKDVRKNNKDQLGFNPMKLYLNPHLYYKVFSWRHLKTQLLKINPSTQRIPPHKAAQKKATRR